MKIGRRNFPCWCNRKSWRLSQVFMMTSGMHHHPPINYIGTYFCHLIPFSHIWFGWNITCHTWSLLVEKSFAHEQWKEAKQANCQEDLMRKISCIKWSWCRKSTQLDGLLYPMTSGRELSNWRCSHGNFGWSVSTLSDWMMGHLFIFPSCIFGHNCDASYYCEKFGKPCWLDDSYTHWGWTWDSHLCLCSNIIVRFNAIVQKST